ncbi:MAG: cysteine desulfurase family protein [Anaerolineae bacterium]
MGRDGTIYLDYAATTPVLPEVWEAMRPYFTEEFGNPSSMHSPGQAGLRAVERSREKIAAVLGCHPREIVFTSGGSESDNLAIRGAALAGPDRGNHIITTAVEHHAVGRTVSQLVERFGFSSTVLPVDGHGMVDPGEVEAAIREETVLISVMYANNEVGTIEPIHQIGEIARSHGIAFHTDAVQAGGYLDLDVERLDVDLLALSAHKFHGPKGVGILYQRRGTPLLTWLTGGGHEDGKRAGTHNVPGIVGMAAALTIAHERRETQGPRLQTLRDRLIAGVLEAIPDAEVTGHPTERMPNSASFVVPGTTGEALLAALDLEGIAASSGSACTAGSMDPSYVLQAMGYPEPLAVAALRFTLGVLTTEGELEETLVRLPRIVARLRQVSVPVAGV